MEHLARKKSIKVAHLLLVHQNPLQLKRLLLALNHPSVSFFIHIDRKCNPVDFESELKDFDNLHYIKPSFRVNWGGYSIIEATLAGIKCIMDEATFTHINLLSGADYPVATPNYLIEFLSNNSNIEFFEYYPLKTEWQEGLQRFQQLHFNELWFPGRYILQIALNKILPSRNMPDNMVAVGRLQWFTITTGLAEYLYNTLKTRKDMVRFFRLCWGTDEFLFQTIAYNSQFKAFMQNRSLRYVHFEKGEASPKILTITDWDKISNGNYFFARKFDPKRSADLLDKIDQLILNG